MPPSERAQARLVVALTGTGLALGLLAAATVPLATGTDPVVVAVAGPGSTALTTGLTLLPRPVRNWAGQLFVVLLAVVGLVAVALGSDLPRVGDPEALLVGLLVFAAMGLAVGDVLLTATGRPGLPPPRSYLYWSTWKRDVLGHGRETDA